MPPKRDSTASGVTEQRLIEILDDKLHNLKTSVMNELRQQIVKQEKKIKALDDLVLQQQLQIENLEAQNLVCNLIIAGVPDKDDKQADLTEIREICKAANVNFVSGDIIDHYRLGKAHPNKVRPIKIKFPNQEKRDNVLLNSKNIRTNGKFKNVYLNKDETKLARAENARLRSTMREIRHNNPEDRVFIRKGKLLHNGDEVDSFNLKNQLQQQLN